MRTLRRPSRLAFLLLLIVAFARPRPAIAEIYDVPILVDNEDDLRDLLENGDIDADQYDRLLHLLERPLDLNRTRRDALYDLPGMTWPMVDALIDYRGGTKLRDVSDLVDVGIPDDVIRQMRPFVKVAKRLARPPIMRGSARIRGIEQFNDGKAPASYLRLRSTLLGRIDVGVLGLLQERPGSFGYHHADGLTWASADAVALRFQVPKFYVMMEESGWGFIVGSYQAGFGQRLVFDESSRLEPNGFYPDDIVSEYEESGKFGVRERLYGAAASVTGLSLGEDAGVLDATVFFSWWPYDASQNDVDSRLRLSDDTAFDGANPLYCEAGVDPFLCATQGTGRYSSTKMRAAFSEMIVGGHVAYLPTPQWEIGLTSYYSMINWVESDDLHFAKSAAWPDRSSYGAYGLDFSGRVAFLSIFGEYARTFANSDAASLRFVLGWKRLDIELSGRYYDQSYDNPHARGQAAADEYEGQRDRDEAGGRLRVDARPLKWLRTRVDLDVWYRPSLDYSSLKLSSRLGFYPLGWLTLTVGLDYTDKDLSESGRDEEYSDDTSTVWDDDGQEVIRDVGGGAKLALWGQVRADVTSDVRLLLFYKSTLWDTEVTEHAYAYPEPLRRSLVSYYDTHFAHDLYVYLFASWKVLDGLTLSTRVKYLDDEVHYDVRGESYIEGWLQVRWLIVDWIGFQIRYRARGYLDDRKDIRDDWGPSSLVEHLVKGSIDVKF